MYTGQMPRDLGFDLEKRWPDASKMAVNPYNLPDTRDTEGYEELKLIVEGWLQAGDRLMIHHGIEALEYLARSNYLSGLDDGTNTHWRRFRRYLAEFERLVASYAGFDTATSLQVFPDADKQILVAREAVDAELIRYLGRHPDALFQLKPRQFEELIAEVLTSMGWQVELTPARQVNTLGKGGRQSQQFDLGSFRVSRRAACRGRTRAPHCRARDAWLPWRRTPTGAGRACSNPVHRISHSGSDSIRRGISRTASKSCEAIMSGMRLRPFQLRGRS